MLNDGQPQSGPSRLTGMAFIHPVKSFKNPFLLILWYADPVILHRITGVSFLLSGKDKYSSSGIRIPDRIVCNIVKHFVEHLANSPDNYPFPLQ